MAHIASASIARTSTDRLWIALNWPRPACGGLVRGRDHPELAAAGARAYQALQGESGGIPQPRAIAAWAMVHGLAHLLLDGQIPSARDDRAATERLIEAILGG